MDLFPRGNAHLHPAYPHQDHIHRAESPQSCGATRPPIGDAGWKCTGKELIIVTTATIGGQSLPVVLPRRALEIIDSESWWDSPVKDFTGGDHLHLKVPRRPTGFRGDSVLTQGDQAIPYRFIGTSADGGQFYIRPSR